MFVDVYGFPLLDAYSIWKYTERFYYDEVDIKSALARGVLYKDKRIVTDPTGKQIETVFVYKDKEPARVNLEMSRMNPIILFSNTRKPDQPGLNSPQLPTQYNTYHSMIYPPGFPGSPGQPSPQALSSPIQAVSTSGESTVKPITDSSKDRQTSGSIPTNSQTASPEMIRPEDIKQISNKPEMSSVRNPEIARQPNIVQNQTQKLPASTKVENPATNLGPRKESIRSVSDNQSKRQSVGQALGLFDEEPSAEFELDSDNKYRPAVPNLDKVSKQDGHKEILPKITGKSPKKPQRNPARERNEQPMVQPYDDITVQNASHDDSIVNDGQKPPSNMRRDSNRNSLARRDSRRKSTKNINPSNDERMNLPESINIANPLGNEQTQPYSNTSHIPQVSIPQTGEMAPISHIKSPDGPKVQPPKTPTQPNNFNSVPVNTHPNDTAAHQSIPTNSVPGNTHPSHNQAQSNINSVPYQSKNNSVPAQQNANPVPAQSNIASGNGQPNISSMPGKGQPTVTPAVTNKTSSEPGNSNPTNMPPQSNINSVPKNSLPSHTPGSQGQQNSSPVTKPTANNYEHSHPEDRRPTEDPAKRESRQFDDPREGIKAPLVVNSTGMDRPDAIQNPSQGRASDNYPPALSPGAMVGHENQKSFKPDNKDKHKKKDSDVWKEMPDLNSKDMSEDHPSKSIDSSGIPNKPSLNKYERLENPVQNKTGGNGVPEKPAKRDSLSKNHPEKIIGRNPVRLDSTPMQNKGQSQGYPHPEGISLPTENPDSRMMNPKDPKEPARDKNDGYSPSGDVKGSLPGPFDSQKDSFGSPDNPQAQRDRYKRKQRQQDLLMHKVQNADRSILGGEEIIGMAKNEDFDNAFLKRKRKELLN